jgi:hypothetical protein
MRRLVASLFLPLAGLAAAPTAADPVLGGFTAASSRAEREWEAKFRALRWSG